MQQKDAQKKPEQVRLMKNDILITISRLRVAFYLPLF